MKKLLLLIDPYPENNPYRINDKEMRVIWFPKLSLPVIAARTPKNWDVRIIDESQTIVRKTFIDEMIKEQGAENIFVGISTQMTCYAPRAYEIADQFRARGVKVCLGGTHATYLPDEAKLHADAVVKFEADEIWQNVICDFERSTLQPFYEMVSYPTMEDYPHPRVDLLPQGCYMTNQCLQTTRGCHFECEFCSVSPFNGKSSRRRSVDDVVAEIQRIKEWRRNHLVEQMVKGPIWHRIGTTLRILTGIEDGAIFAFVDDLHNSNRAYCKELWTALKELGIKWGAQCTLFLGSEPEMVRLAAESGCIAMFVGMESISQQVLEEMNKPFNNEKKYEDQIKCFHDHGIMVNPGIIFGSDGDDESVFENTVEFLIKNHVELAYINISTPLPGTALFARLKAEGRIFDWNWANYDGKHVVYHPKRMTPEVLQEGFFWANRQFFSLSSIVRRVSSTKQRFLARWIMNWRFRNLIRRTCPQGYVTPIGRTVAALARPKGEKILAQLEHVRKNLELRLGEQLANLEVTVLLLREGKIPRLVMNVRRRVAALHDDVAEELKTLAQISARLAKRRRLPVLLSLSEPLLAKQAMLQARFLKIKEKLAKNISIRRIEGKPEQILFVPNPT